MNGRTNSSGSSVNDLQIPLDPCTNLECVAGNAQVELTWTDPLNKYATPEGEVAEDPDQLVSVWHHTVVIRKVGSAPVGIDDGIVVASSEVKNQYQSTAYIDTGLVNDTTYYYGVFAINEDGVESEGLVSEGITPKLGTPLSELAEGTIIKIKENGSPVEFYLAKHNYEPDLNGPGRELLVRKDVYSTGPWHSSSVDAYINSDIDHWMSNSYPTVLSEEVKDMIGITIFYYTPSTDDNEMCTLGRTFFPMSAQEMNHRVTEFNDEGSVLPIYSILRRAYMNGSAISQWTRSPHRVQRGRVCYISSSGSGNYDYANRNYGYRPSFTLSNNILCDGNLNLVESIN